MVQSSSGSLEIATKNFFYLTVCSMLRFQMEFQSKLKISTDFSLFHENKSELHTKCSDYTFPKFY